MSDLVISHHHVVPSADAETLAELDIRSLLRTFTTQQQELVSMTQNLVDLVQGLRQDLADNQARERSYHDDVVQVIGHLRQVPGTDPNVDAAVQLLTGIRKTLQANTSDIAQQDQDLQGSPAAPAPVGGTPSAPVAPSPAPVDSAPTAPAPTAPATPPGTGTGAAAPPSAPPVSADTAAGVTVTNTPTPSTTVGAPATPATTTSAAGTSTL